LDPSGEGHGLAGVREAEFATGVGAVHGAWEMACEGTERGIVGRTSACKGPVHGVHVPANGKARCPGDRAPAVPYSTTVKVRLRRVVLPPFSMATTLHVSVHGWGDMIACTLKVIGLALKGTLSCRCQGPPLMLRST
jgi:hypothetical protein